MKYYGIKKLFMIIWVSIRPSVSGQLQNLTRRRRLDYKFFFFFQIHESAGNDRSRPLRPHQYHER